MQLELTDYQKQALQDASIEFSDMSEVQFTRALMSAIRSMEVPNMQLSDDTPNLSNTYTTLVQIHTAISTQRQLQGDKEC